jgi:prepilin-type processing-associated H-X9-DG protein
MNGNLAGRTSEVQRVIRSQHDIALPSNLFAFIDEHEQSIDDAHFLVWPAPDPRWVNLPSARHLGSGTLSFTDGHVEHWRWRHGTTFSDRQSYWKQAAGPLDLTDLRRLQACTLPLSAESTAPP